MPVLERSTKVKMPVDDAERCWNDFVSKQGANAPKGGNGNAGNVQDPGQVYFNQVDDKTTQVTIQLDSQGIAEGDEKTLNQRVDSYLEQFKGYVEKR